VTRACNHDCLHCYNVWKNPRPYPGGELDTQATLALLDKLCDEMQLEQLTLSGGEPLMREDLPALVQHLRARGLSLSLITNGALLEGALLERLAGGAIEVFELPLLSSERALHDRLSGAPGAFDRATMAIAELKLRRQVVVAVFVVTRLNLGTFRETVELAVALGVDALMLNRFNPGGRGAANLELLQASPAELERVLAEAEELSARYELQVSCSIALPPCLVDIGRYPRLGFGYCAAGTERAYYTVDPAGNLRPCNHSPTILGNLRERSFAELVAGEAMCAFVAARPEHCAGCRLERECLGGCKAAAESCYGSASLADPFLAANLERATRLR
jgi:pyrroloquinoline quinone biosynthesis protein E